MKKKDKKELSNLHDMLFDRRVILTKREYYRKKYTKTIQVPYLIFTTNKLNPKWLESGASFHARFDVVEFPLSADI